MRSVREEDNGKVLRLFITMEEAMANAQLLARGSLERFHAIEHKSKNGWLVQDKESGRQFDAAGLIQ